MESIDPINSLRRSLRLSPDGQFWLRMLCILPFSLGVWAFILWWAFQQLPIYASQLADGLSSWTNLVAGSADPLLIGGDGDAEKMARSTAAARGVSGQPSNYPQRWRWRGVFGTAAPRRFGKLVVTAEELLPAQVGIPPKEEVDPFGVTRFLDRLRRSQNDWVAFIRPRTLFPITQHAANGSSHDSSLPTITRTSFASSRSAEPTPDHPLSTVSLVAAELPEHVEVDTRTPIPE